MTDLQRFFKKQDLGKILILLFIVVLAFLFIVCQKPLIQSATYEQLLEVYDVGPILSVRILSYVENNVNFDIEDLVNVKGIDKIRLKYIKRKFR